VRKTKTASPSTQRSAHLRRLSITLLGALALSACSPSIPQGAQWADDPFRTDSTTSAQGSTASATKNRATTGNTDGIPRGSGTLRIAYAPGWRLPADYVSAFEAASGYTVEQSEYAPNSSQNADVIFGVDSKQAAALGTVIPVGNNPVCAWADRSWFSANSKALPSSLKDLSSANFAPLTAIPSQDSEAGAAFTAQDRERVMQDAGIVRNKRKIDAAITNAQAVIALRSALAAEGDAHRAGRMDEAPLAQLLWPRQPYPRHLGDLVWLYQPREHTLPKNAGEVPAQTEESRALSAQLKRRGFVFVGPVTALALMSAIGIVNTDISGTWKRPSN